MRTKVFAKVLLVVAIVVMLAGFALRQHRLHTYEATKLENEMKVSVASKLPTDESLRLPLETLEYWEPTTLVDDFGNPVYPEAWELLPFVVATDENAENVKDEVVRPKAYLAETGEEIPFTKANPHKVIVDVSEKFEDGKHIVCWTESYTVQFGDTLSEIVLANGWLPHGMNLYDYLNQCVITDNVSARGRKLSEIDIDEIYVGDKIEWRSPQYEIVLDEDSGEEVFVTTTEWFSESLHWEHLD